MCKIGNIWRCFLCRWPENRGRKALSFHTSLLIDTNRVRNKQKWNYVCNAQKNLTLLYVRQKILARRLTQTKSPIPPSPTKFTRFHHVVVFKTKVLYFKIENTPIKTQMERESSKECSVFFLSKNEKFSL